MTCNGCDRPLRPRRADPSLYPGTIQYGGRGMCRRCAEYDAKGIPVPPLEPDPKAIIEDVQWMIETGENPDRVAERAGWVNRESLRSYLKRHGRPDLAKQLETIDFERNTA